MDNKKSQEKSDVLCKKGFTEQKLQILIPIQLKNTPENNIDEFQISEKDRKIALKIYLELKNECLKIAKKDLERAKQKFSIDITKKDNKTLKMLFNTQKAKWVIQSKNIDDLFASMNIVEFGHKFLTSVSKNYWTFTIQEFVNIYESKFLD